MQRSLVSRFGSSRSGKFSVPPSTGGGVCLGGHSGLRVGRGAGALLGVAAKAEGGGGRCGVSRVRKNPAVIPGRVFRAGPGIEEHRPNRCFHKSVFMASRFAGLGLWTGDPPRARGRWGRLVLKRGSGGGGRLAAIRGERSAAPAGHRRADERGAGLASVESSATTNFVTGSRRRTGQILP